MGRAGANMKLAQGWHTDPSAKSSVAPESGGRKLENGDPPTPNRRAQCQGAQIQGKYTLSDLGFSAAPNVLTVRPWP